MIEPEFGLIKLNLCAALQLLRRSKEASLRI